MKNAKIITRSYTQTLKAVPSKVFPLLCTALTPAGEEYMNGLIVVRYNHDKLVLENMLNHYLTTREMKKIR